MVRFRYEKPALQDAPKVDVPLAKSAVLVMDVKVIRAGSTFSGEADPAAETLWFVMKGRARFYDGDDSTAGEFGRLEGVVVPRGVPCKFEPAGGGELAILRITAIDPRADGVLKVSGLDKLQPIRYDNPDFDEGRDIIVHRFWDGGDMLSISVEKVRDGEGDDGPHAHFGIVGAWLMLSGRIRFHGALDADAFEIQTGDGVFLPSGNAYGFRAIEHEPAEILHVKALDMRAEEHMRVDY
jgi:mannose-6-phosphate isomerase-like protein (cupin superfamily)